MFRQTPLRVEFTARGRVTLLEPLTWEEPPMRWAVSGLLDPTRFAPEAAFRRITVPAGFVSDGVTVPPLAWPLVGHPYSGSLLRAALLHDWELVVRDNPAHVVHDRFRRALRASGVGQVRAWLMWAAVRLFGPRW